PTEKRSRYNLSFNQKRLWFIYQRDPHSPAFNMPDLIELPRFIDAAGLKKALRELFRRHESLRTGFTTADEEPVQFIAPHLAKLPCREIDISHLEEKEREQQLDRMFKEESLQVFDLTRVPLFRSLLVKLADEHYVFIFVMHHIICDGWSLELFKNELIFIYECYRTGQPVSLKPLRIQYRDFSEWHNRQVADNGASVKSHRFWKQKIEQGIPRLLLPANMGADSRDVRGSLYRFLISPELQGKLKKLSRESNTTLFMVMFALYVIALSRYSNQQEIACSIISAGREHESLHPVIGFFVNSILFRTRIDPYEGFAEFLRRVSSDAAECFVHQNYPLEIVFQEMKKRYPDIQVSFNMANLPGDRETGSLEVYEPCHLSESQDVKFDLEPYIFEYKNGIDTMWAYKKGMFSARMIEYFVRDYVKLLEFFTAYPYKSYGDFKAAGKKKKMKLTVK
ncbi:MAG: hypothetical protein KAT34_19370, partial [Candidatus Aminicenantes bacterium]|nr:hypothetical protein [Candidatus Aminicenantes bacterium]